jgi:hypothetical protein
MALSMTASPQESWMDQLDVTVKAGYKSFLEGWQTASAMLQEQVDVINPTMSMCTCKRACDNSQFVMPAVIVDDEATYPYSTSQVTGAPSPSPFSPREGSRATTAKVLTPSPLKNMTFKPPTVSSRSNDIKTFPDIAESTESMATSAAPAEQKQESRFRRYPEESQDVPVYVPPPDQMGNFGYYAEYSPVLRPPTSICTMNINTGVRAAPWQKWLSHGKSQGAASQTGSSLVSKGEVGCSQVSNVFQNLDTSTEASAKSQVDQTSDCGARQSPEAVAHWLTPTDTSPPTSTKDEVATPVDAKTDANAKDSSIQDWGVVPQLQDAFPEPIVPKIKVKSDMRSVLSQSTALKSSAAMALSQAAPEQLLRSAHGPAPGAALGSAPGPALETPEQAKCSVPEVAEASAPVEKPLKPRRTDASALDRKSALSTSTAMTSSAAMALGGLGKVGAKRRGGNDERGSTETVVHGTSPAVTTPASALGSRIADNGPVPEKAVAVGALKPPKAANRQGGSRSRGPDAKSVISGLNSSSSASALLGPMMLGQPKRRSARPEGADVASVI